ncbi:hypothetical protein LTR28_004310 [Elasticomyces elasticus]|nr:hypothetical protein LTR28_004310 [Elasticomyces elasticus]
MSSMSTLPAASETPTPNPTLTPASASESRQSANSKPQRLLACVLCQQRKVKCDHNYPCATCVRARVQCVQATQASRRRKRRFPERELLARLRQYEDLLSQHNVKIEPLHPNALSAEDKNSSASSGKGSCGFDDEKEGKSLPAVNGDVRTTTPVPDRTKVYETKYVLSKHRGRVISRAY